METINDRIARVRELLEGDNNKRMADAIKTSPSMLSSVISGSKPLTDKFIMRICDHYHISEHWLRTGEGEMSQPRDEADTDILIPRAALDTIRSQQDTIARQLSVIEHLIAIHEVRN